jgi:hypothetical protein
VVLVTHSQSGPFGWHIGDACPHLLWRVRNATRSGRAKGTAVRVLATLLDPDAFPVGEIAACYARRWQVRPRSCT